MLGVVAAPSIASAQYRPSTSSAEAVGEDYHIEAAYSCWNAEPSLIVNSESLEIIGTDVNLITDLGIEKKRLGMFDVVLRPARSTGSASSGCRSSTRPTRSRSAASSSSTASGTAVGLAGDDLGRLHDAIALATSTTSCISSRVSSARCST